MHWATKLDTKWAIIIPWKNATKHSGGEIIASCTCSILTASPIIWMMLDIMFLSCSSNWNKDLLAPLKESTVRKETVSSSDHMCFWVALKQISFGKKIISSAQSHDHGWRNPLEIVQKKMLKHVSSRCIDCSYPDVNWRSLRQYLPHSWCWLTLFQMPDKMGHSLGPKGRCE